jgi:cupin superfamily acireductone dioxygenase involved in methionine salvage
MLDWDYLSKRVEFFHAGPHQRYSGKVRGLAGRDMMNDQSLVLIEIREEDLQEVPPYCRIVDESSFRLFRFYSTQDEWEADKETLGQWRTKPAGAMTSAS